MATLPAFDELADIEGLLGADRGLLQVRVAGESAAAAGRRFPIHVIACGSRSPTAPAVAYIGGVHGLERIGTRVVLAYLRHLLARAEWDETLQRQLESLRFVFMPLVNPGGMWSGRRSNPNGVDLMRNAPLDAGGGTLLVGGQRLSRRLPWYRGRAEAPMEAEAAALCRVVEEELFGREFSLAVDCHSGFGLEDRIWFPYAHTHQPMPHLADIHALKSLFDRAHAQHRYIFEPQNRRYLAHGDLWDYLYLRAGKGTFLPLTLEMGSWRWIAKSPLQLLSRQGLFNPLDEHRRQRVLRRHLPWLDFLSRAACSHRRWLPRGKARAEEHALALARWYPARRR